MSGFHVPGLFVDTEPWMDHARCRIERVETEVFYPVDAAGLAQPLSVCGRCDVRGECLDYALERNESHGVWGGTSERERRRLRRRLRVTTEGRTVGCPDSISNCV